MPTMAEKLEFMQIARGETLAGIDAVKVNATDAQAIIDVRKSIVDLFDGIDEDIKYADKCRTEAQAV